MNTNNIINVDYDPYTGVYYNETRDPVLQFPPEMRVPAIIASILAIVVIILFINLDGR